MFLLHAFKVMYLFVHIYFSKTNYEQISWFKFLMSNCHVNILLYITVLWSAKSENIVWNCSLFFKPSFSLSVSCSGPLVVNQEGQPLIEGKLKEKQVRWKFIKRWKTRYFTLAGNQLLFRRGKSVRSRWKRGHLAHKDTHKHLYSYAYRPWCLTIKKLSFINLCSASDDSKSPCHETVEIPPLQLSQWSMWWLQLLQTLAPTRTHGRLPRPKRDAATAWVTFTLHNREQISLCTSSKHTTGCVNERKWVTFSLTCKNMIFPLTHTSTLGVKN